MREYIISGVPLRDPSGAYWIDYSASSLLNDTSRLVTNGGVYGAHGDRQESYNYFGSGKETLVINIAPETEADADAIVKGFQGLFVGRKDFTAFSAPHLSPLAAGSGRAGRSFNVAADALRTATLRGAGSMGEERINARTGRLTVVLENIYAFWQSNLQYTNGPVNITSGSQVYDLSTLTGEAQMPITQGIFRIKGPFASGSTIRCFDRDTLRSIGVTLPAALAATEYVWIDFATLKAGKVTTDVWTGGTDYRPYVEPGGEGAFSLDLGDPVSFPGNFYYGATVASNGYTSGTSAFDFRIRRSYGS